MFFLQNSSSNLCPVPVGYWILHALTLQFYYTTTRHFLRKQIPSLCKCSLPAAVSTLHIVLLYCLEYLEYLQSGSLQETVCKIAVVMCC